MHKYLFFIFVLIQSIFLFGQSDQDKQLHEVCTLFYGNQLKEAKNYIENNFLKSNDKSRQVIGYIYLAQYYEYTETNSNKKHLETLEKAKKIAEQTNNELDKAYVDFGYTMYYKSMNRWNYYVKYLWKSINSFKKYPDENFILSKLYVSKYKSLEQNPLEKAKIDDYTIALNYAKKSKDIISISSIYNDIGNFYNIKKNSIKTAEQYYNKSFQLSKQVKDKVAKRTLEFYFYSNSGNIYLDQNKFDKALDFYNKGLEITTPKDSLVLCALNNSIGYTYALMGKNKEAIDYYNISEKYSKNNDISEYQRITIYTNIYEAYEKLKQYENTIQYLKKTKNAIVAEDQRRYDYNVQSLESFYNTEEKNHSLEEKNLAFEKQRKYLIGIIALSISSIIALGFMFYYKRKMLNQRATLLESEKEKLKMEKEISDLKQEHYQKQVLATTIQLEQKNKFLEELKENFKKNKEFNLNNYLKNEQIIDKDLTNIHDIVKEVHPNFFKKLNEMTTTKLTNLDIKYAAYIYMNMDNSQIASILSVDPKTVSVTKYRLKQKLNLSKEVDLDTFIRNLS
ncbi:tetratricopeptide repeat protein [Empedobacter falsenii]|uniref:Tetratricopeptide repeat protein n=1 Tax=Empedobacter falsenii TaxID=343874 RepID=A0AAW7DGY1_9FLAO|nr:LuxR C-terminal-related transcriptional regulator [Empedobacter falsenii]MDM1550387.1 tetratricopeptide repeat protein [Empedobacter falsenii]